MTRNAKAQRFGKQGEAHARVHLPGAGQPVRRHGQGAGRGECDCARGLPGSRRGAGPGLFRLMSEGPEDQLTLTANAQPAIMAHAIAVLRVLEKEGGVRLADKADFVAGHSLGEYTALCAAGSLDLATTAKLLRIRGDAMQAAVPVGQGSMAALLGAELIKAQAIADAAAECEVCTVANDNDPGQVVISGATAAIERAIAIAKEHGAKRALLLPVSAPFHCPMMQPAADAMEQALAGVAIQA